MAIQVKSEVFKFFYLEITDFLADLILRKELKYDSSTKLYCLSLSGLSALNVYIDLISEEALSFDLSDFEIECFKWFFKRTFIADDDFMMNRLNLTMFNPFIMSPMVMMYLCSRSALCSFASDDGKPLDMVFSEHLDRYNSLLDHPLTESVINSMKSKFYDDEDGIKTMATIWFNFVYSSKDLNGGLLWFNNTDCSVRGYENKAFLTSILSKYSFANPQNINALYQSYEGEEMVFSNTLLRNDLLNLYYRFFSKIHGEYNLNFYGVGFIPLVAQALYSSVTIEGERICINQILKPRTTLTVDNDAPILIESAMDFALSKSSSGLREEHEYICTNHKLILELIADF